MKMALTIEISSALTAIQSPEQLTEEMAFLYAKNLYQITEERLTEVLRDGYPHRSTESAARKEFSFFERVSIIGEGIEIDDEPCGLPEGEGYSLMMEEFVRVITIIKKLSGVSFDEEEVLMKLAPLFRKLDDARRFLSYVRVQKGDIKKIGNVLRLFKDEQINGKQGKETLSILWEFGLVDSKGKNFEQCYDTFKDNI